jgi:hypothetical protein
MCVGLAFPLSYLVQPQQRVGRAVVLQQQHAPTRPNHAPHRPQRLQASMDGARVWSTKAPVRLVVGPLSTPRPFAHGSRGARRRRGVAAYLQGVGEHAQAEGVHHAVEAVVAERQARHVRAAQREQRAHGQLESTTTGTTTGPTDSIQHRIDSRLHIPFSRPRLRAVW